MDILAVLESSTVREWVERLRARDPLPLLVPAEDWDPDLTREINDTAHEQICAGVSAPDDGLALSIKAGLLLWNDALEPAHVLCQEIRTTTGSYWHGILHRREPDFGNSKYWFHRVGSHAAFQQLKEEVRGFLLQQEDSYARNWAEELEIKGWDPFQYVDRCEQAAHGEAPDEIRKILERVQVIEIENLLGWCAENLSQ